MRDVRSSNYFEQMKGRGTRTLSKDDLQKVTPSATENKDHFVIVDAVGVTKSKKTETRTLERKPAVSMKELMMNIALGARDEDTLTSLANRVIRLSRRMERSEHKQFKETVGQTAEQVAENLLNAFDEDVIQPKHKQKAACLRPHRNSLHRLRKSSSNRPLHLSRSRKFAILLKMSAAAMIRSSTASIWTRYSLLVMIPIRRKRQTG